MEKSRWWGASDGRLGMLSGYWGKETGVIDDYLQVNRMTFETTTRMGSKTSEAVKKSEIKKEERACMRVCACVCS